MDAVNAIRSVLRKRSGLQQRPLEEAEARPVRIATLPHAYLLALHRRQTEVDGYDGITQLILEADAADKGGRGLAVASSLHLGASSIYARRLTFSASCAASARGPSPSPGPAMPIHRQGGTAGQPCRSAESTARLVQELAMRIPFFHHLPEHAVYMLVQAMQSVVVPEHTRLVEQGATEYDVFVLLAGEAAVFQKGGCPRSHLLAQALRNPQPRRSAVGSEVSVSGASAADGSAMPSGTADAEEDDADRSSTASRDVLLETAVTTELLEVLQKESCDAVAAGEESGKVDVARLLLRHSKSRRHRSNASVCGSTSSYSALDPSLPRPAGSATSSLHGPFASQASIKSVAASDHGADSVRDTVAIPNVEGSRNESADHTRDGGEDQERSTPRLREKSVAFRDECVRDSPAAPDDLKPRVSVGTSFRKRAASEPGNEGRGADDGWLAWTEDQEAQLGPLIACLYPPHSFGELAGLSARGARSASVGVRAGSHVLHIPGAVFIKALQMVSHALFMPQRCFQILALSPEKRTDDERWVLSEVLQHQRFLLGLEPTSVQTICRRATLAIFQPGEAIIRAGESGYQLFFILEGSVHTFIRPDSSQDQTSLGDDWAHLIKEGGDATGSGTVAEPSEARAKDSTAGAAEAGRGGAEADEQGVCRFTDTVKFNVRWTGNGATLVTDEEANELGVAASRLHCGDGFGCQTVLSDEKLQSLSAVSAGTTLCMVVTKQDYVSLPDIAQVDRASQPSTVGLARQHIIRHLSHSPPGQRSSRLLQLVLRLLKPYLLQLNDGIHTCVCQNLSYVSLGPNQPIFQQGDAGEAYYIILSGTIALHSLTEVGRGGDAADAALTESRAVAGSRYDTNDGNLGLQSRPRSAPRSTFVELSTGHPPQQSQTDLARAGSSMPTTPPLQMSETESGRRRSPRSPLLPGAVSLHYGPCVHLLSSGDAFGEVALLCGKPHTVTAITTGPCELLVLSKEHYDRLVRERQTAELEAEVRFLHVIPGVSALKLHRQVRLSYYFSRMEVGVGHVLLHQGSVLSNIFIIRSGEVRIYMKKAGKTPEQLLLERRARAFHDAMHMGGHGTSAGNGSPSIICELQNSGRKDTKMPLALRRMVSDIRSGRSGAVNAADDAVARLGSRPARLPRRPAPASTQEAVEVARFGQGRMVGEIACLLNMEQPYTVVANSALELHAVRAEPLLKAIEEIGRGTAVQLVEEAKQTLEMLQKRLHSSSKALLEGDSVAQAGAVRDADDERAEGLAKDTGGKGPVGDGGRTGFLGGDALGRKLRGTERPSKVVCRFLDQCKSRPGRQQPQLPPMLGCFAASDCARGLDASSAPSSPLSEVCRVRIEPRPEQAEPVQVQLHMAAVQQLPPAQPASDAHRRFPARFGAAAMLPDAAHELQAAAVRGSEDETGKLEEMWRAKARTMRALGGRCAADLSGAAAGVRSWRGSTMRGPALLPRPAASGTTAVVCAPASAGGCALVLPRSQPCFRPGAATAFGGGATGEAAAMMLPVDGDGPPFVAEHPGRAAVKNGRQRQRQQYGDGL